MKMINWFDKLSEKFPEAEKIDELIELSLRLMSEIGIKADNPKFLEKIRDSEGIKINGNRVYFDTRYAGKIIEDKRQLLAEKNRDKEISLPDPDKFTMTIGGYGFLTIDPETGKYRDATVNDLIRLTKLGHVCGCNGPAPFFPQDVPGPMRDIATYRYCYEYSDKIFGRYHFDSAEEGGFVYEMMQAVDKPFRVTLCFHDAMEVNPHDLEKMMYFIENKKMKEPWIVAIAYHLPGITGPLTPLGCQALQLAEQTGMHMMLKSIYPDSKTNFGIGGAGPTDLTNCGWAFGSSRTNAYRILTNYILNLYSSENVLKENSVSLMTGSGNIDIQTAVEKSTLAMAGALGGASNFACLGNLATDDINSAEQFVIDVDIIEYVKNTLKSCRDMMKPLASLDDTFETVRAACSDGVSFLMAGETLTKFRDFVTKEALFEYKKSAQWNSSGKSIIKKASERVEELLAKHDYKCDPDKLEAMDKVYREAEKYFASK